jgi:hypothetical protein
MRRQEFGFAGYVYGGLAKSQSARSVLLKAVAKLLKIVDTWNSTGIDQKQIYQG